MGKRIAVTGGGLVVDGHSGVVGLRIGEGVDDVAERHERPARACRRHLRLERVALGFGCNRIGGTMNREHCGLDVSALGGLRRDQRAVHGHDRGYVCAGASKIEHVEPAEAKADSGATIDVADRPPIRLAGQGVEPRGNAPAHGRHIRHERFDELHRVLGSDRTVALAEHVGDEDRIALLGEHLTGLDRRLDDTAPIGRHEQERPISLDRFIPDERTATADARYRIENALDRHRPSPPRVSLIVPRMAPRPPPPKACADLPHCPSKL